MTDEPHLENAAFKGCGARGGSRVERSLDAENRLALMSHKETCARVLLRSGMRISVVNDVFVFGDAVCDRETLRYRGAGG